MAGAPDRTGSCWLFVSFVGVQCLVVVRGRRGHSARPPGDAKRSVFQFGVHHARWLKNASAVPTYSPVDYLGHASDDGSSRCLDAVDRRLADVANARIDRDASRQPD